MRSQGYAPKNAEEVRVTALMNVLYYAQAEDLPGLLTWCSLLVRAGELSPDIRQALGERRLQSLPVGSRLDARRRAGLRPPFFYSRRAGE
jgi:hypothetical protein